MSIEFEQALDAIIAHDLKDRHSYFQLQYFIIGKEPTIQAKLWRCVRELKTRKETIAAIKLEIDDINDDLELINIKIQDMSVISTLRDEIKKRKLARKKTGLSNRLENLNDRLKNISEEAEFLIRAYQALEKKESIKPYDDLNSQKQYWDEKLGQEFNLRMLLGMPMDLELIKTILALSSDSPVKDDAKGLLNVMQERIENKARAVEYDELLAATKTEDIVNRAPDRIKNGI